MGKKKAVVAEESNSSETPDSSESVPSGQLGDWLEEIPVEVRDAADSYISVLREYNAAKESMNYEKQNCIEKMKEHGVTRVRIDEGGKYLVCEDTVKLKTEKAKKDDGDD